MRSPTRLERYRQMRPAEKLRELLVLEAAAHAVWQALPESERRRRRLRARRQRLVRHARLLARLAAAESCPTGA